MTQIGRIGGPLLEENLIRNGVDIAFRNNTSTTQLLYVDVNNRRIGINLNNPSYELEIFGTTRTVNLIADDLILPNLRIEDNEINAVVGNINLDAADAIVLSNLETSEFTISDNRINTIRSNANIDLIPNGTGTVETDSLRIFGNLTTPGTITLGGTITFGNNIVEDTVNFNTDVSSNIVPDQTLTYDLGSPSKKWRQLYTDLVNGAVVTTSSISGGGIDLALRSGNIFYVAVNGDDTNAGDHPQGPFATIRRALDAADASNGGPVSIFVYPGEYQEQLPLVVPSNVSIIGEGIRSVTVVPATGYETEDVFHLNGETTVQHLTIKDFYYDNINNTGYAFRFAPNAIFSSRSPYVQDVSVITNTELVTPRQITVGPAPTGVSLTSNSVTLSKTFYSQALVDLLVGQTAVIDRYPNSPLFYTVISIVTEPSDPTQWRMTVDTTFDPTGQIKPISFYSTIDPTLIITNDIWDTSGSSVGEKWVAYFKTNLPANFETTVQPGWTINVAGTIYIVDYIIEDPVNTNQWRIYVTTFLVGGTGIPIFSSPTTSTTLLAGCGAWIDGSEMDPASIEASMLFHSCTFITPNADAITMTNGVRVEWLNSFTYFANRGLYAVDGATGRISQDGSTVIYGAEIRSIGSASVYGNYGAVADGADTLMYLIQHNFGYIGSGLNSSNDKTLAIQANEAVELNSGRIYYSSTDHLGNFRVGTTFYVDFENGTTSIDTSSVTFDNLAQMKIGTDPNFTFITYDKIDTGNIRISGNTVESLSGEFNIDSASENINFNSDVNVAKNLAMTGNFNFDGSLNLFGNAYTDTVDFNIDIEQNFNPNIDTQYNLGSISNQWLNVWLSEANINSIRIFDNVIQTQDSNSDLELRANGSGRILIPSNNVSFSNDLTVVGNSSLDNNVSVANLNLNGVVNIVGDVSVQSQTVDGFLSVTEAVQFEEILVDDNVITTTSSNANLELRAEPTGIILVPTSDVLVSNSLSADNIYNTSTIAITNVVEFNKADVANIDISQNYITTNNGNLDLVISAINSSSITYWANGSGFNTDFAVFPTGGDPWGIYYWATGSYLEITLSAWTNTSAFNNLLTVSSGSILQLDPAGYGNLINFTSTSGWVSQGSGVYRMTGTWAFGGPTVDSGITNFKFTYIIVSGDITLPNSDVIFEQDLTVDGITSLQNVTVIGTLDQLGLRTQLGNYAQTGNLVQSGNMFVNSAVQFSDISVDDNVITPTVGNNDLDLRASGTGKVLVPNNNVRVTNNLFAATITTGDIIIDQDIDLDDIIVRTNNIQINDNYITTTISNSDLELRATGDVALPTNDVIFDQDLTVNGTTNLKNIIINGTVNHTGNRTQTGNYSQTGNLIVGQFSTQSDVQLEAIKLVDNFIATTNINENLILSASGIGDIVFDDSLLIAQDLTAQSIVTSNLTINNTFALEALESSTDIQIFDNVITTTNTNSNLELRANSAGDVLLENVFVNTDRLGTRSGNITFAPTENITINSTGAVKLPSGTTLQQSNTVGDLRFDTSNNVFEARGLSNTITFNGVYSSDRRTNLVAHPTNNTLNLTINTVQLAQVTVNGLITHRLDVDDIVFDNNAIFTNASNSDLELRADGSGELLVEAFTIKSNIIVPTTLNSASRLGGTGQQWIVFEGNTAVKFPSGDTGSRPASPVLGQTRHNIDSDTLETWIGDQWRSSAGQFDSISVAQMEDEAFIQTLIYG